jgi:hypothetical protein
MLLVLSGCGSEFEPPAIAKGAPVPCNYQSSIRGRVDSELQEDVRAFFADARKHGETDCPRLKEITFADSAKDMGEDESSMIIGLCISSGRVKILKWWWTVAEPIERKGLIYHELGHCLLKLDHSTEPSVNLMSPYILTASKLADHWDDLVDKLFARDYSSL